MSIYYSYFFADIIPFLILLLYFIFVTFPTKIFIIFRFAGQNNRKVMVEKKMNIKWTLPSVVPSRMSWVMRIK